MNDIIGKGGPPGNGPGAGPVEVTPEQMQQIVLQQAANAAFGFLATMYPEKAQVSPEKLQQAAIQAARDIPQMQQVLAQFTPAKRAAAPDLGIKLTKASPIVGGKDREIFTIGAVMDIGQAPHENAVFTMISLLGVVMSVHARALLYLYGYRLHFMTGKLTEEGPKAS